MNIVYLTIILVALVGYEMIDSQRGAYVYLLVQQQQQQQQQQQLLFQHDGI